MVEQAGSRVFWAVQGVLVGGLVLLAGLTLQREVAVLKLHTEVGELKGLLAAFSGRETSAGEEVFISKKLQQNPICHQNPTIQVALTQRLQCEVIQHGASNLDES